MQPGQYRRNLFNRHTFLKTASLDKIAAEQNHVRLLRGNSADDFPQPPLMPRCRMEVAGKDDFQPGQFRLPDAVNRSFQQFRFNSEPPKQRSRAQHNQYDRNIYHFAPNNR